MGIRLNRELKAYCTDFETIRRLLRNRGAVFVEVKEQMDVYYYLPIGGNPDQEKRRLKFRTEQGKGQLIYYCDRQEGNARTSRFQIGETGDLGIGDVLGAALGIRAIVRKRRELWQKDNVIFNLDTVEGVGQILEVEVQETEGCDIDSQVNEYRRLFEPHWGGYISSSNEDLAVARDLGQANPSP